jgi:hypothetical protein
MSNLMQETVDWSLYPFRLMARTMDIMSRTTSDVESAFSECVRPQSTRQEGSRSESSHEERFRPGNGSATSWRSTGGADLSGDDIKVVQSYIASTKPDHEQVFEVHTEIVNYSTTADAYSGVVVGRFLRQHPEWADEDLRYLKPHIKVVERYPKEDEEYADDIVCHHHHRHDREHREHRESRVTEPLLT